MKCDKPFQVPRQEVPVESAVVKVDAIVPSNGVNTIDRFSPINLVAATLVQRLKMP